MLADLGADVVKVEPPELDVTRTFGRGPQTPYFCQQNAGKRAITVDLVDRRRARPGAPTGRWRPTSCWRTSAPASSPASASAGTTCRRCKPSLIMLSISGFGQDGPERDRAAYAGVIHAEMGLIARQPGRGDLPHVDVPISMADVVSGLHGLVAILAALRHRDATGEGNHIDLAMVDALLASDDVVPLQLESSSRRRGERDRGRRCAGRSDRRDGRVQVDLEVDPRALRCARSVRTRRRHPDQGTPAPSGVAGVRPRLRHPRGADRVARSGQPGVGRGASHQRGAGLADDAHRGTFVSLPDGHTSGARRRTASAT